MKPTFLILCMIALTSAIKVIDEDQFENELICMEETSILNEP